MADSITDIWFRSRLSLREIAARLSFENPEADSEDFWEWIIGTVGTARYDLTRTHTRANHSSDARIFLLEGREFTAEEVKDLITRLRTFVPGTISCGGWIARTGNDFDKLVVEQHEGSERRSRESG